jgi:hypothetical protein
VRVAVVLAIGAERAAPSGVREMVDRYTKAVLTVIAMCLLWLCMKEPTVVARARTKSVPAKQAALAGPVPVRITNWSEAEIWLTKRVQEVEGTVSIEEPVEVTGTVDVNEPVRVTGSVDVTGTVDVDQPVQVTGKMEIDQPVQVEGKVDVGNWSSAALWLGH